MLVLSRKVDQKVELFIDNVKVGTIVVVDSASRGVRLGFDMQEHVKVFRKEISPHKAGQESAGESTDE